MNIPVGICSEDGGIRPPSDRPCEQGAGMLPPDDPRGL